MLIGHVDGSITFVDPDTYKRKFEVQENSITDFVSSESGGWNGAADSIILKLA